MSKVINSLKRIRLWCMRKTVWRRYTFGKSFHAGRSVVLWAPTKLDVGENVYIGRNSQIECDAVIGDHVIMANNVSFVGRYDHHFRQTGVPIRNAMQIRDPEYNWKGKGLKIEVGDDVWIGLGVIVLSGVKIGKGTIIAAGSVVTNSIGENGIYAGCPAKKLSDRFRDEDQCRRHWEILHDQHDRDSLVESSSLADIKEKEQSDILLVGQKPPPFHGQAVVTGMLFDHDWDGIKMKHLYMEYSGSIKDVGKTSIGKIFHLFTLIFKTWKIAIKNKPKVIYYLPASPRLVPVIRDVIYLSMTRPFFRATIFHYHAGGVTEFLSGNWLLSCLARLAYSGAESNLELCQTGQSPGDVFSAKHVRKVPNGLDVIRLKRTRPDNEERCRVLFVGAMREGKGVLELLKSAVLLKKRGLELGFYFVGTWNSKFFESQAISFVQANDLTDCVTFKGSLIGDDKWLAYADADIFCLPTHYVSENFPLVLIEAMAYELPIVTTRWRGVKELVGDSAIMCDVKSPDQYADAIERLAKSQDLRKSLGVKARKRYEDNFTLSHFLGRMQNAFTQVLSDIAPEGE